MADPAGLEPATSDYEVGHKPIKSKALDTSEAHFVR